MQLEDIIEQLSAPLPAEAHKERTLPGGGRWFYLSHQTLRDRLNEVCPGYWDEEYSDPAISGDYTVVRCKLTICGVSRMGVADDKTFPELNSSGKSKVIGSPVVNAYRHAFRDACEKFGLGSYLDEQNKDKRAFTTRYLQQSGDARGVAFSRENNWSTGSLATAEQREERMKQEQAARRVGGKPTRPAPTRSPSPAIGVDASYSPAPQPETNENLEWFRRLTKSLQYNRPHGDNVIKKAMKIEFPDTLTADLDPIQRNRVAGRILVLYGEHSNPKAESLFQDAIANDESTGTLEPEALAELWLRILSGAMTPA